MAHIDLNKSGKSLEPFQIIYRTKDQQYIQQLCIKFMAQWCHCHDQEENTNYHPLLRENWSGWSRVNKNHQKASLHLNQKLLEDSCQCPQSSTWLRGYCVRKKTLLQTSHLKAWLKFAVDHMDKEKNLLEENSVVTWNKNWVVWPQWASICSEDRRWGLQPQEHKTFCQAWC